MDFDSFLQRAWADHADATATVAQRLGDGAAFVADEAQWSRLAELAHHVHGAHLGAWRDGAAVVQRLMRLPAFAADGPSGATARRVLASLALCDAGPGQSGADLAAFAPGERARVCAMAASNLAEHDAARAAPLLQQAIALVDAPALAPTDPAHRQLAVAANNLAATLEEKSTRNADERALMILAAQTGRREWALAGGWLEIERAEYRLAMTWLQAGEPDRARTHAQACLDIVEANDGAAIERLFGWEALGRVERAAGHPQAHAHALAQARAALAQVGPDDRAGCVDSVEQLAAPAPR